MVVNEIIFRSIKRQFITIEPYSDTCFISLFIIWHKVLISLWEKRILVSAAKSTNLRVWGQLTELFMNSKNRSGSRIDPWGTPHVTCNSSEQTLLYTAIW